jgi:molecular chaperone GrpE
MSGSEEHGQGPVIRDRRRIDPVTGQARHPDAPAGSSQPGGAEPDAGQTEPAAGAAEAGGAQRGAQPRPGKHAASKPGGQRADGASAAGAAQDSGAGQGEEGMTETGGPGRDSEGKPRLGGGTATATQAGQSPNLDVAMKLAERTADLQRLQAEYVNYRKRVERDRAAVREQSLASVLAELLPVLDDIGRAREHGELTGGFKSVAESLEGTVTKLGLTTYGEAGEPFDPNVHEALMHAYSPDVTETTCVQILQPGYKVGERILRPARVAVAEPSDPSGARTVSSGAEDEDGQPAEQAEAASDDKPGGHGHDDTE